MILRLLLILTVAAPAAALENTLVGHPSPYLAMHGQDPVAWQDWGEDAVAHARKTGKLLFVSSGYFSCHWCHVMQSESYRDAEIAALLNRHFVPVKLDRELYSALDDFLIDFVRQTTGQAGWPLNVFLTPDGLPLIGATYLRPQRFKELLVGLNRIWTDEQDRMRTLAQRTQRELRRRTPGVEIEAVSSTRLRQTLLDQTLGLANLLEGGFGDQGRFPMAPQLLELLDLQAVAPDPRLAEFLQLTLDNMASQGLRDHLSGGFFRYTVDPGWQVPHFEKMLYTQALLSEVYLIAGDLFGRQDYAEVTRDTLRFVAREMRGPQGGFIASLSAVDGGGEEGGVYLWSVDQLHAVLGEEETALARRHWGMLGVPPFDGGHLPRRGESVASIAAALEHDADRLDDRLQRIRRELLVARAARELPADDKELAGWNGLMLAAFSKAARRWDDAAFHQAARQLRDFLHGRLWDGRALRRAVTVAAAGERRPLGKASLADYAYVAYGMTEYARLSGQMSDRAFVTQLLTVAWQRFYGPSGWRMDDESLIPAMAEVSALRDGALPAPSGLLIRLALVSDSTELVAKAKAAAEQARGPAQSEPLWYVGHYAALLALDASVVPPDVRTRKSMGPATRPSP